MVLIKARWSYLVLVLFLFGATVQIAHAHEVYVLTPNQVSFILSHPSQSPFEMIFADFPLFSLWAFIAITTVIAVFLISISRRIEELCDPFLFSIKKPYAILICRITLGLSLIASGYYGALFGPDLLLTSLMTPPVAHIIQALLIAGGVLLLLGFGNRIIALFALLLFCWAVLYKGTYMFTYTNHLGEVLVTLFLGAHAFALDKKLLPSHKVISRIERLFEQYGFLILRVSFGISLIFASVYAKIIHSSLALTTVVQYNLTDYFHFAPMFIVLGAAFIEIALGVFFIIGFEIRFASLFLIFFLTLSVLYFGEAVWPHFVLFGVALALFTHGYDKYTIEGYFFKNAKREPVL